MVVPAGHNPPSGDMVVPAGHKPPSGDMVVAAGHRPPSGDMVVPAQHKPPSGDIVVCARQQAAIIGAWYVRPNEPPSEDATHYSRRKALRPGMQEQHSYYYTFARASLGSQVDASQP